VHGAEASIQKIRDKYPEIQVESMEGAAFFYACLAAGVPFAEIRSISNRVEPRNRDAWDLPLAIRNLNGVLVGMLEVM
jgi:futalosine hydrolase